MARLLPLSKGCQYAIRTAAFLSLEPAGTVFPRREVSRRTAIPYAFVSKILQTLTRAGFLRSHRGSRRGYSLARPARQINLLDVVAAYDGPLGHEGCLLDEYKLCPGERVCAVHHRRMAVQKKLTETLSGTTIADVAKTLYRRHGKGPANLVDG
ncbi:MAG: Rrf2 family transcriptional regulator [candidate division Zixibacteria bacterium]|nr:Rrf2 family transcriptional regulator [candidate division Zixibacteria bacterium]MCI0596167.1 Rrf2 family transcriptional regulator [candidate division Zixibacteria bacterium]